MVSAARSRCKKKKMDFNLSVGWAIKKLLQGKCEATGVFFNVHKSSHWDKLSPSVDRVDSKKGYTIDNCQMVTLQFNIAKGQWSNDEMLEMCKLFVKHSKKRKRKSVSDVPLELVAGVKPGKNKVWHPTRFDPIRVPKYPFIPIQGSSKHPTTAEMEELYS